MKTYLLIALLLYTATVYSQSNFEPIDRDSVEKRVSDASSDTYYPKLIQRLEAYDSTLTTEDYRLIYYGFVFQDKYSPYADNQSKEINEAYEKKNYKKALKICDEALKKNPVALKVYYYKLIMLSNIENSGEEFRLARHNYSRLLETIAGTGDGYTCKTAFKVITVSDEYEVIYRYFNMKQVLGQKLQSPCDNMGVTPNDYFDKANMFFDVSECFMSMDKMFKQKE